MRSLGLTLGAGEEITAPLTETRPAAIQASAARREASPARAITLAMRSPELSLSAFSGMSTIYGIAIFHANGARRSPRRNSTRRGAGRLRRYARQRCRGARR